MPAALVHLVVCDRGSHVFHMFTDPPLARSREVRSLLKAAAARLTLRTLSFSNSLLDLFCVHWNSQYPLETIWKAEATTVLVAMGFLVDWCAPILEQVFYLHTLAGIAARSCVRFVGWSPRRKNDQHQAAVNVSEFCACADGTMHLDMKAVTT